MSCAVRVELAAKHDERLVRVRPHEAAIERVIGVDRAHDVRLHVAQLDAVADLIARVDRIRELIAVVVEPELGDVADVHRVVVARL